MKRIVCIIDRTSARRNALARAFASHAVVIADCCDGSPLVIWNSATARFEVPAETTTCPATVDLLMVHGNDATQFDKRQFNATRVIWFGGYAGTWKDYPKLRTRKVAVDKIYESQEGASITITDRDVQELLQYATTREQSSLPTCLAAPAHISHLTALAVLCQCHLAAHGIDPASASGALGKGGKGSVHIDVPSRLKRDCRTAHWWRRVLGISQVSGLGVDIDRYKWLCSRVADELVTLVNDDPAAFGKQCVDRGQRGWKWCERHEECRHISSLLKLTSKAGAAPITTEIVARAYGQIVSVLTRT